MKTAQIDFAAKMQAALHFLAKNPVTLEQSIAVGFTESIEIKAPSVKLSCAAVIDDMGELECHDIPDDIMIEI